MRNGVVGSHEGGNEGAEEMFMLIQGVVRLTSSLSHLKFQEPHQSSLMAPLPGFRFGGRGLMEADGAACALTKISSSREVVDSTTLKR